MDQWLRQHLACPRDRSVLRDRESDLPGLAWLDCGLGHEYPVLDGIPVMLLPERRTESGRYRRTVETVEKVAAGDRSWFAEDYELAPGDIDPLVARAGGGCGIMFSSLKGRLARYPIPEIKVTPGSGGRLLDVGCYWGRWTVSAARAGYRPVGIDVNLEGVRAARRVARQLQADAAFLVADARFLPFGDGCFDAVWSYSVVQHFTREDARMILEETARVLSATGCSVIQMPNRYGVRNLYNQVLGRHRRIRGFGNIWYWSPLEIRAVFEKIVGPTEISVDGFFGLGIPDHDLDLFPPVMRTIARLSRLLRGIGRRVPWIACAADSLYARSYRGTRT